MPSTALAAVGVFLVGAATAFVVVTGIDSRHTVPCGNATFAQGQAGAPLELVALEHDRDGDRFIVRGIVRNPAAAAVNGLLAAVSLLNQDGGLVASGQAAVASPRLAAGAQTPFVVIVPGAAGVDRYHLSFRTAAGVVPHLDRRAHGVRAGLS